MLMACLAFPVRAQEVASAVEDRVEAAPVPLLEGVAVDGPPIVNARTERGAGWDFDLVVSTAYDDNIFLSATSPQSDMVLQAAPMVAYTHGDGDGDDGGGGFVKAAYRPTLVVYASNGSESRVDHQFVATAGWRGKATRLTYAGSFQKLGDATPETGRAADRLEFSNEIRAAWIPRDRIVLESAVGNRRTAYDDPFYYDSGETYGEVAVRYLYSPKTEIGLVCQIGRLEVDRSDTQDIQQLTADIVWNPREKIRFNVRAGAERRDVAGNSGINPVLEGRLDWAPREGTGIYLTGYMREEASAYQAGQNYSARGVAAGVTQRVNQAWSATLEGGLERDSYEQVSGSGASGRLDRIWFVRPALVLRLSDESDLAFFYRASEDDSSDPVFGFRRRIVGIEYNLTF